MGKMTHPLLHVMRSHEAGQWQPEIGLARLDHDEALMGDIVQLLASALSQRLEAMQSSASSHDFESLRQHTHAQLPSLKILGFDQQAKVFEAFESAVVMADDTACRRLSPMVQRMWQDIIDSLNDYQKSAQLKSCA